MLHGRAPAMPLNDAIISLGAEQNCGSGQHALTSGNILEGNEHILLLPHRADEWSDDLR